jgi:hypothetical protein
MAGADDLIEVDGREVPLIELDACNFVPASFHPGGEPFWDLLYVARPVAFKGFPAFLGTVRALYDAGHDVRVLCLCPTPPASEGDSSVLDVRAQYEDLFHGAERSRFTLLTMDFDYPFPLDLATLSHFYRSTQVFAHFADDERRCRVAGYAWATGMSVVGVDAVGSLLSDELRRPPYFYEATTAGDPQAFATAILAALAGDRAGYDVEATRAQVSEEHTRAALRARLDELFPDAGAAGAPMALDGLNLRLGRHHGLSTGANRVPMTLGALLDRLDDADEPGVCEALTTADPDLALGDTQPAGAEPRRRIALPWRRA